MGADVYLKSVTDAARKKYEPLFNTAVTNRDKAKRQCDALGEAKFQKQVRSYYDKMYPTSGYYRDAYNSSAFLWVIGLSWWNDVTPMLNKKGYLPIKKAKELVKIIEAKRVTLKGVQTYIENRNKESQEKFKMNAIDSDFEGWFKRWRSDKRALLALLRKSIELNEPLYCSL